MSAINFSKILGTVHSHSLITNELECSLLTLASVIMSHIKSGPQDSKSLAWFSLDCTI